MDVRSRAPQTEDALDCVLLDGALAAELLAELQQQNLLSWPPRSLRIGTCQPMR